jgi:NhaP-type Na+/H+ or K+/H+ antiporter
MKLEDSDTENSINPTYRQYQERVIIIEKGSSIISAVFIVSFLYSVGFFTKYYHNKCWESIISSLIVSSIFTCIVGFLIGKYFTRKLKT